MMTTLFLRNCVHFSLVSAVGCSDVVPPSDAWLKRSDDVATVGCYMTRQTWVLTCDHTGRWTGTFGNCTQRTMPYLLFSVYCLYGSLQRWLVHEVAEGDFPFQYVDASKLIVSVMELSPLHNLLFCSIGSKWTKRDTLKYFSVRNSGLFCNTAQIILSACIFKR